MPISVSSGPDPKVAERLAQLVDLQAAGIKWYWRSLGIIVAIASIVSAVFQALNYFHS